MWYRGKNPSQLLGIASKTHRLWYFYDYPEPITKRQCWVCKAHFLQSILHYWLRIRNIREKCQAPCSVITTKHPAAIKMINAKWASTLSTCSTRGSRKLMNTVCVCILTSSHHLLWRLMFLMSKKYKGRRGSFSLKSLVLLVTLL